MAPRKRKPGRKINGTKRPKRNLASPNYTTCKVIACPPSKKTKVTAQLASKNKGKNKKVDKPSDDSKVKKVKGRKLIPKEITVPKTNKKVFNSRKKDRVVV